MRPLTPVEVLALWEHGYDQTPLERILALLGMACPEMDLEAIAELCIGERDARLLQLREWMFGSQLFNTATCPQCTQRVEWKNRIDDIRIDSSSAPPPKAEYTLKEAGYQICFRVPNSMDIITVINRNQGDRKPQDLLRRCIISAEHEGEPCELDQLPTEVMSALEHRLEELDPQAEIKIRLTCPQCSHRFENLFDIASFFWAEINHFAERTLLTVHKLASAYGWSERDILNLSPVRRQLYLGLVEQ